MKKQHTLVLSLLSLSLIFTGCAHYQAGTGNKTPYSSIAFAPIQNKSFAPQMHTLLTDSLFRNFAQGGGMAVEKESDQPDVVLHVTITDFNKYMGATSATDSGRARSLGMTLKANATLTDTAGKVLYSQDFDVYKEFYADSGMSRAESQGLPQLADDMAQKIYRAVVSKW